MAKSTYYVEIGKIDAVKRRNQALADRIQAVFIHHKQCYGVRRVHQELVRLGYMVNHKRVQRLMHQLRLSGIRPGITYRSYKGAVGKTAANIIDRNFKATAPLQKWMTDVSQFTFSWGKYYLSPILDMYTNEIISFDLSLHPTLQQIERMLHAAFTAFPKVTGLILHSDQGWQYQHLYFRETLRKHGMIQSMSRKGNCYDNSIMESYFGRMKTEMYYGYEDTYPSFESFSAAVAEYIQYYNTERIQQKTKWMPPVIYKLASM